MNVIPVLIHRCRAVEPEAVPNILAMLHIVIKGRVNELKQALAVVAKQVLGCRLHLRRVVRAIRKVHGETLTVIVIGVS